MQRLRQRLGFGLFVGASSSHARLSAASSPHIVQHRLFASFSASCVSPPPASPPAAAAAAAAACHGSCSRGGAFLSPRHGRGVRRGAPSWREGSSRSCSSLAGQYGLLTAVRDVSLSVAARRGYDEIRPLGQGTYGRVMLVRERETGRYVAMKVQRVAALNDNEAMLGKFVVVAFAPEPATPAAPSRCLTCTRTTRLSRLPSVSFPMTRHLRTTGIHPPVSARQVVPLSPRCPLDTTVGSVGFVAFSCLTYALLTATCFSHSTFVAFALATRTPPPCTHHARRHPRMRLAVPLLLILARFV